MNETKTLPSNGPPLLLDDLRQPLDTPHESPYRLQSNSNVDRFDRTLAREWTYAHTYTSQSQRKAAYQARLHHYNHHRPRTALGAPPNRVHNLAGKYD